MQLEKYSFYWLFRVGWDFFSAGYYMRALIPRHITLKSWQVCLRRNRKPAAKPDKEATTAANRGITTDTAADTPLKPANNHAQNLQNKSGTGSSSAAPVNSNNHDDLKQIKGIGPKLEKLLHEAGITSYSQIAGLQPDDITKLSEKLGSFRGRIERDSWVTAAARAYQAKYGQRHQKATN